MNRSESAAFGPDCLSSLYFILQLLVSRTSGLAQFPLPTILADSCYYLLLLWHSLLIFIQWVFVWSGGFWKTAAWFVHTLVVSCFNYCNRLLAGIPESFLHPLILVQNSAFHILPYYFITLQSSLLAPCSSQSPVKTASFNSYFKLSTHNILIIYQS